MFKLWLVWRYLAGGGSFLSWTSGLAILGMVIGVACLVISMAVVSGVQSLLRNSIVDVTGHVLLSKPGEGIDDLPTLESEIRRIAPETVAITPYVEAKAVLPHKGVIGGILVKGLDADTIDKVLNLRSRVIQGEFNFGAKEGFGAPAIIGKEIAKKFSLNVGDAFQLVVPRARAGGSFSPKAEKFFVRGVMDFGKYEFNERFVIVSVAAAQSLADIGPFYTGLHIRLQDAEMARDTSFRLSTELGLPYSTRGWKEISHNFFSAVELEKQVIFAVLMLMVVAASFNISSVLFVNVLRRYEDISILKTLGMTKRFLIQVFVVQGLLIGFIGAVGGVTLGMALSWVLAKMTWLYIPAEIYKFDRLPVDFRPWDMAAILAASFVICFISTFAPARRGAYLNPVEGLRYE